MKEQRQFKSPMILDISALGTVMMILLFIQSLKTCRFSEFNTIFGYHDHQIVRLSRPMVNIKPAILNREPIEIGCTATTVSVGLAQELLEFPNGLQSLEVKITECHGLDGHQTSMYSTSDTGELCPGDSGEPLYMIGENGDQTVVSSMSHVKESCSSSKRRIMISSETSQNLEEISNFMDQCSE